MGSIVMPVENLQLSLTVKAHCGSWAVGKWVSVLYTRLLRKALDVSWQQHMTNEELYGKIPSAMHQLRDGALPLPDIATAVRISR